MKNCPFDTMGPEGSLITLDQRICTNRMEMFLVHAPLTEHRALRHKLKSCTIPFVYRSELVKSRRMLYSPNVCNCTMSYLPRTVPAYAVRDPAYTAEVFALALVQIDVSLRSKKRKQL